MALTDRAEGFRFANGDGWIFVVLVIGIVALGESLKVIRTPALLLIVLIAAFYARQAMLRSQHLPLLLFSAFGLIYVILSYVQAFPAAWTRYHDTSVIFQQASFLAVLLPVVAASQKWWDDVQFDINRDAVMIAIVLVAFFLGTVVDIILLGWDRTGFRPSVTMRNYVFIGLLALTYLAFRSDKWRGPAIILLLILFGWSVWSPLYLQNTLVHLILVGFLAVAMLRIPADRLMLGLLLLILVVASIVGMQDPLSVFEIDANTGWRLAWWRDALEATAQTWGIGTGFGTESIRNEYADLLQRDQYREEEGTFLLVSTHSAFVDTIFRTGAVGFLLLCTILVRCFPNSHTPPLARAHCCAMFAVLILCLHSNLGLQSPMYSLGVAICIGYLQSERRKALNSAAVAANRATANLPHDALPLHRY